MLKLDDPRIKEQLLPLPTPDHSYFGGNDDVSDESSSEDSSEESSTESRTGVPVAEAFLNEEAAVVNSGTNSTVVVAESGGNPTIVTFQLKVSVPRYRRNKRIAYHGFGSWNLKQHSLLFQQVNMANLCHVTHVHITYDFENLSNSHGSILPCMLADIGKQVWPYLKTLKICITYEVDLRFPNWSSSDPVSKLSVSSHRS